MSMNIALVCGGEYCPHIKQTRTEDTERIMAARPEDRREVYMDAVLPCFRHSTLGLLEHRIEIIEWVQDHGPTMHWVVR